MTFKWGAANEPLEGTSAPIEVTLIKTPQSAEKFLIHRSAVLSYKACPYKAYLEFWANNHGWSGSRMSQSLIVGICIHRGLQHLLEHCRVEHPNGDFEEKCVDDAVDWGHKVYREILEKKEPALKFGEDLSYTIGELYSMIEALIRAYAAFRLRPLLEEYEVLEVEKEEVFDSFSSIVTWLGKADGLFRRRRDNKLVVLSIKTTSEFTDKTLHDIVIDMQGCSEIAAIEDRLNAIYKNINLWHQNRTEATLIKKTLMSDFHDGQHCTEQLADYLMHKFYADSAPAIELSLVQYEYLVKGKKRCESGTNNYKFSSHLLHPIKEDKVVNVGMSGLRFASSSGGEYEWIIPTGKLPKNKRKIDIAADIGVKEWIYRLNNLEIQPEAGHPFEEIIIGGERTLVSRSREQIEEWRTSTEFEAEEIANRVRMVNEIHQLREQLIEENADINVIDDISKFLLRKLRQFFRRDGKDSGICYSYYGEVCMFAAHCHEGMTIEDGVSAGMYVVREPHHELEKERFIEKGYLED